MELRSFPNQMTNRYGEKAKLLYTVYEDEVKEAEKELMRELVKESGEEDLDNDDGGLDNGNADHVDSGKDTPTAEPTTWEKFLADLGVETSVHGNRTDVRRVGESRVLGTVTRIC